MPLTHAVKSHAVGDGREKRAHLASMVMKLFDHWKLTLGDAAELLGLSSAGRSTLARYKSGAPLAPNRDLMERVGHLLSIHQSLRILFPRNRESVYAWPTAKNADFEGLSPVEYMKREGFIGVAAVRRYLDFQRGQ